MRDLKWLWNRLRSMNVPELMWRMEQKLLQRSEYRKYYLLHCPVTEIPLASHLKELRIHEDKLPVCWENTEYSLFSELTLLGNFPYAQYRSQWNAGFQTENQWEEHPFSYQMQTSGREDIGDIRTNWELNRHFQFACLAKSYYVSGDESYRRELEELFEDWNQHNLLLHGAQWTSAMELAIRVNSWCYTYAFLARGLAVHHCEKKSILKQLEHGILAMTDYIVRHRARYSSANNHLLVEMYAVGLAGILFDYRPWQDLAVKILTRELPRQNFSDGVNREMSLHYQTFAMEAYGLLVLVMKHNNLEIPEIWTQYLTNMSHFVADSCGDYGETVVFGDNDEGKLLDLQGQHFDHYRYVLDMMGCLLPERYTRLEQVHENLLWLISKEEINACKEKKWYQPPLVSCYREGGYTFLRSKDRRILIGIDHADLGFGAIAAHGHADALSFQMFVDGIPVFVDPGTFNYHVPKGDRDLFRSTAMHNTVSVDGKNQSEILGPFLWGKRAKTILQRDTVVYSDEVKAEVYYEGIIHKRTLALRDTTLEIEDEVLPSGIPFQQQFLLNPECTVVHEETSELTVHYEGWKLLIQYPEYGQCIQTDYSYSPQYNVRTVGTCLQIQYPSSRIARTVITCMQQP